MPSSAKSTVRRPASVPNRSGARHDRPGDLPDSKLPGEPRAGDRDPHARSERFLERRPWRDSVTATAGFLVLAGLWLMFSPLAISYTADGLVPVIAGALVVAIALIWSILSMEGVALPVSMAVIGVGLLVSGDWASNGTVGAWNLRLIGGAVLYFAFAGAAASGSGFIRRSDEVHADRF